MISQTLNTLLLQEFPELRERIEDEISWQDGMETGSHVVFGDVFTPYLQELAEKQDEPHLKRCFAFIEKLLTEKDPYAEEVLQLSVLESIIYDDATRKQYGKYLGELTTQIVEQALVS